MSKIIFINPSVDKYADIKLWNSDVISFIAGQPIAVMPKMSAMILAALTPPKHNFVYLDEEIEDIDFDGAGADLVGLTAMTAQAERAYEIADEFRKRGVTVVIGGIHASVLPDEAALHADAVCIGEGESIWPAMLEDFEAGVLKQRYEAKDYPPVSELASPRADIIKHGQYSMYPVMTTKGCPYDCDFCSIRFTNGNRIRVKPVEQVMKEIDALERYNTGPIRKSYQFVDDNLYANRNHMKELLTALKNKRILWHGQGTLNTANDEEILTLMAESGCRNFSIGFESLSEASLQEVNKTRPNKIAEYESAVANLIRHGIVPAGFFIFGFDNDDKTVFKETLDFVQNNYVLNPFFSILTPYPGTRVYERMESRIFDRDWRHYWAVKSVFTPNKMTAEELDAGHHWVCDVVTQMDTMKRQLEYFWSQGPWPTNPRLTLKERAGLLAVVTKFRAQKKYTQYIDFIMWAASNKNAVDVFSVLAAVAFNDMAGKYFVNTYDPGGKSFK